MVQKSANPALNTELLLRHYHEARSLRANWESHWRECYDYVLPNRDSFTAHTQGEKRYDRLFDATAADAVDQLAASLLAQLTPPWSRWFGLKPGPDLSPQDRDALAPKLEIIQEKLQSHFDRSNFAVEMHQCYLDLVTAGTASLHFDEARPGHLSAFQFTAVPLSQITLDEGARGQLDYSFREVPMTLGALRDRYSAVTLPREVLSQGASDPHRAFPVLEITYPDQTAFIYIALLLTDKQTPLVLREARLAQSPFINFRWLKSPGEVYGRSPVMKALPDIKTANKVVELILKNASISVTGIWQADDDGVLNPANIKLVPGAIIPKAVGSAGLTPLAAPGKFDVSQIILTDLRNNIRRALLTDQLGMVPDYRMTATEVLQRGAAMARILGATYGRLQSELLTPLMLRAISILQRRGEIPLLPIDGRMIELDYRSPLAMAQGQRDVQNILQWLQSAATLNTGAQVIDQTAVVRWLGEMFGVPSNLMKMTALPDAAAQEINSLAQLLTAGGQHAQA